MLPRSRMNKHGSLGGVYKKRNYAMLCHLMHRSYSLLETDTLLLYTQLKI